MASIGLVGVLLIAVLLFIPIATTAQEQIPHVISIETNEGELFRLNPQDGRDDGSTYYRRETSERRISSSGVLVEHTYDSVGQRRERTEGWKVLIFSFTESILQDGSLLPMERERLPLTVTIQTFLPAGTNISLMHLTEEVEISRHLIRDDGTLVLQINEHHENRNPSRSWWFVIRINEIPQPTIPLFRMFHEGLNQHLWTTCANEYEVLATRGWNQEGIAWHTPAAGRPVHRLFHEGIIRHHYTADQNEIRVLIERGWNDEGPLFYCASPNVEAGEGIRMTRLFHDGALKHLHTADANEVRILTTEHGWNNEGESFVGLPIR